MKVAIGQDSHRIDHDNKEKQQTKTSIIIKENHNLP